jgi:hypothetical protein
MKRSSFHSMVSWEGPKSLVSYLQPSERISHDCLSSERRTDTRATRGGNQSGLCI